MKRFNLILLVLFISGCKVQPEQDGEQAVPDATRTSLSEPSYMPNGTYSSFNTNWCTNGKCDSPSIPASCSGVIIFGAAGGDFTVYSDTSATFWDSIPEPVSFNLNSLLVTMASNTTGHVGYDFTYQYLGGTPAQWQVTYGKNCGRLYFCYLGDCLKH